MMRGNSPKTSVYNSPYVKQLSVREFNSFIMGKSKKFSAKEIDQIAGWNKFKMWKIRNFFNCFISYFSLNIFL